MIYNETLVKGYGTAPSKFTGSSPTPYYPTVTSEDYALGYVKRAFAKKVNENCMTEIKISESSGVNLALYKIVTINWKVSGPKNDVKRDGILDKAGVIEQNRSEIQRIYNEETINLTRQLPNLLEFWRGY